MPNWIKIEDRFPKEGDDVIIYTNNKKMYRATTIMGLRLTPFWLIGMMEYYIGYNDIKYWMPDNFPDPPKED